MQNAFEFAWTPTCPKFRIKDQPRRWHGLFYLKIVRNNGFLRASIAVLERQTKIRSAAIRQDWLDFELGDHPDIGAIKVQFERGDRSADALYHTVEPIVLWHEAEGVGQQRNEAHQAPTLINRACVKNTDAINLLDFLSPDPTLPASSCTWLKAASTDE